MTGQGVGSDASRLSCFLFRPRKRLEKRKKRSHTNVSNASLIRTSTLPAQTAHVCFHSRKRVHTRLSEKDGTQRLTRRNRSLPSPGHGTVLCCQRNPFCSATLLYTYISRFSVTPHYQQQFYLRPSFITFFYFSHKWPTFAFTSESGYTLAFANRIAHSGLHAETGAFPPSTTVRLCAASEISFIMPCFYIHTFPGSL